MREEGEMVAAVELERAVVSPEAWTVLREQAAVLVRSGFLPNAVNTPEKAISIVMKGRELGIPPMYALSNIAVINGKPTAGAELMLALIYRDHGDEALRVVETTAERCTVAYRRRGWQRPETFTFTLDQARCAGLLGKDNWRHYPAAMLRARCISAVARLAFPDTIGGLYTPEELGARVQLREDGEQYLPAYQDVSEEPGTAETVADARLPDSTRSEPATPEQRAALARLSHLLLLPEPGDGLERVEAARLLNHLSRQFNQLDPEERRRRTRSQGGMGGDNSRIR